MHDLIALAAQITVFAGSPPQLDPRLQLAACPSPVISWAATRAAVVAECRDPAWRIFAAVRAAPAAVVIRRGDAVTVNAGGIGFRVAVEGIADDDAGVGMRLRVKTAAGAHLTGIVGADGSIKLPGYSVAGYNSESGGR